MKNINRKIMIGLVSMALLPRIASAQGYLSLVPDNESLNELVNSMVVTTMMDPQDNLDDKTSRQLGRGICRAEKGAFCDSVKNLGEGICRAADGQFCDSVASLGQGICRAAKGQFCDSVTNLGQGICRAAKGQFCDSVKDLGEGICIAKGGSFCDSP